MIRDIAIYVLIFALGMMAGYLLKVVMVKKGSRGQVIDFFLQISHGDRCLGIPRICPRDYFPHPFPFQNKRSMTCPPDRRQYQAQR